LKENLKGLIPLRGMPRELLSFGSAVP
jgi:hypothetical protein